MINIIKLQKNKDMNALLYELNNSSSFKRFIRGEKIQRYVYYFVVVFMLTFSIISNFIGFDKNDDQYWINDKGFKRIWLDLNVYICDFTPVPVLLVTIIILLY